MEVTLALSYCLVLCSLLKRKGNRLIFLSLHTEICLSAQQWAVRPHAVTQSNSETSAEVLGRVIFSLLRSNVPGIGLSRDRDKAPVKHRGSCGVRNTFVGPWKSEWEGIIFVAGRTDIRNRSPRWIASGYENNVGKGSRQLGSVTSEQGLALRTGLDGLVSEANCVRSRAGCLPSDSNEDFSGHSELEWTGWWAISAMFVRFSDRANFVWHKTVDSELARTRGIRLSN